MSDPGDKFRAGREPDEPREFEAIIVLVAVVALLVAFSLGVSIGMWMGR